jgi:hypothetical protein
MYKNGGDGGNFNLSFDDAIKGTHALVSTSKQAQSESAFFEVCTF